MPYGYADPATSPTDSSLTPTGETFLQRQMRLRGQSQPAQQQQQQQQSDNGGTATASGSTRVNQNQNSSYSTHMGPGISTGTPVTGNGQIPSPTPQVGAPVAAPATPPASAPQPMTLAQRETAVGIEDRGNNLVYIPSYGGVVDRNSAWYTQAMQNAPPETATAGGAGGSTTPVNSDEHGRGEASRSGMFTQFQAPDHDFENWQQLQLVQQLLSNPETLSPHVIDQLQQRMSEEQLSMAHQLGEQESDDLISRGFSPSGGTAEAQTRARNENLLNAILGKRRDIEISAAQQNRQDQLQALQAAEGILQGQTGRAGSIYNSLQSGEQANRDDFWKGKQLALQDKLGTGGLSIDQQRVNQQGTQFDSSHALDILRFLEGQRQFDDNSGLQWTQLGQQGQNATWDRILAAAGLR